MISSDIKRVECAYFSNCSSLVIDILDLTMKIIGKRGDPLAVCIIGTLLAEKNARSVHDKKIRCQG